MSLFTEEQLVIASDSSAELAKLMAVVVRNAQVAHDAKPLGAEAAARACHALLLEVCEAAGQKPKIEVMMLAPGERNRAESKDAWFVCWEAGPYEWGINASHAIMDCYANTKAIETYYGFDLLFYPKELGA